jgi:predicted NAD/FAD-dependent oxidoreductase
MDQTDCLVIGSGIAGLTLARQLHQAGKKVIILDKGRGIGGRLATRRISDDAGREGSADFGAQFFTIKSEEFRNFSRDWFDQPIVREWFDRKPVEPPHKSGRLFPRYMGLTGMRSIAYHLGRDMDIRQQQKVVEIRRDRQWQVTVEDGDAFYSSALVLTMPIPQALELLAPELFTSEVEAFHNLQKVRYHRCITVMGILKNPSRLPPPGAIALENDTIMWITDNQRKGISPNLPTYTIHCTPAFSLSRWETPEPDILQEITPKAEELFGSLLFTARIHRWKYANPEVAYPAPFLMIRQPVPLILAGDGFVEGRIESAALSGMTAARALLEAE